MQCSQVFYFDESERSRLQPSGNILVASCNMTIGKYVLGSFKENWPTLKIVHGKARHSYNQISVERANKYIENMLCTSMKGEKK